MYPGMTKTKAPSKLRAVTVLSPWGYWGTMLANGGFHSAMSREQADILTQAVNRFDAAPARTRAESGSQH